MSRQAAREPHRYKPHGMYAAPIHPERCAASVNAGRSGLRQCGNSRRKGSEWCHTHDPAAIQKREQEKDARWEKKRKNEQRYCTGYGLAHATDKQLIAEMKKRGYEVRKKPKPYVESERDRKVRERMFPDSDGIGWD
jgi:uncharacterized protein (DUF2461 family)